MKIGKIEIDFKPEVGNVAHIKALDMIASISRKMALLKKKQEAKKGADALKREIDDESEELKKYVDFINKK